MVPARDEAAHIAECASAILAAARMAGLAVEVIVVDDDSSDDTAARALAAGATVLRQPRRMGPLAAWAAGVSAAKSPWIVFVDADCSVGQAALAHLIAALHRPGVGVAAARAVPVAGSSSSLLVRRSARFSAALVDQVKARLSNHDLLPVGRLMAIRREAWMVDRTDQPHCDRVVAASAKAAGWTVTWVPEATVMYELPVSYGALRADWYRTRLALSASATKFDSLPAGVILSATWVTMWRFPMDAAAWAACHSALVIEHLARRPPVGHFASWGTQAETQTVGGTQERVDVKTS
ncbi:MAG: glycosyltransferase [Actinomycetota bacterium]|nr:glycosyltransferase [Actinomycetota bacterium]